MSADFDRSKLTRLSVNLNQETADALRKLANDHGLTFTETVRRAISLYHYLEEERDKGNKILIDEGKEYRELILL